MVNRRRKQISDEAPPLSWTSPEQNAAAESEPERKKRKRRDPSFANAPVCEQASGSSEPPTQAVCPSQLDMYITNLHVMKRAFVLADGRAVALNDCDSIGQLLRPRYSIVEVVRIADRRGERVSVLLCSCVESAEARERLTTQRKTGHAVDQIVEFEVRERARECLHCQAVRQLHPHIIDQEHAEEVDVDTDGSTVDCLDASPLTYAVKSPNGTYGIVWKQRNVKCISCNRLNCPHITALKLRAERDGFDDQLCSRPDAGEENAAPVSCVSTRPISFPPSEVTDPSTLNEVLVEPVNENSTCEHGSPWAMDDPVEQGWIRTKDATLYYHSYFGLATKQMTVCYRKTSLDTCQCALEFDGGQSSILNLSNTTLIHHGVLFQCLAAFATSAQPLIAMWRTFDTTHCWKKNGGGAKLSRTTLQNAWNAFIALLNMPCAERMLCDTCGRFPDTIILDGHSLGLRHEVLDCVLADRSTPAAVDAPILSGSRHEQRVLLRLPSTRSLLRRFISGKDKAGRQAPLNRPAYFELLRDVRNSPLEAVIVASKADDEFAAKESWKKVLDECCRNTPVCGIIPLIGNEEVRRCLVEIENGTLDPFGGGREQADALMLLQRHLPVWTAALEDVRLAEGAFPPSILALQRQLLTIYDETFANVYRPPNCYSSISNDDRLAYFPHWPAIRGLERYEMDGEGKEDDSDQCTKHKYGHPMLTPGIVVYLCKHAVCYGFSLMDKPESPRMPFVIFTTRWERPPDRIIYDNSCKLHVYCLNREPILFKNCHFMVDRFHFYGHTACSKSYDMRSYRTDMTIMEINSSACEQFNSLLIKLKPSLSYMKLDRFFKSLKLFMTLRLYYK